MGMRFKLLISSVMVPLKPGSTNPAVLWMIMPRRPRESMVREGVEVVAEEMLMMEFISWIALTVSAVSLP